MQKYVVRYRTYFILVEKYEGHLSVGICSCRYGRSKLNEGCGDSCEEWCIGVGDMADYCVETNKGRKSHMKKQFKFLRTLKLMDMFIK